MGARLNVSPVTCAGMSSMPPKFTHMLITELIFNTVKSEGALIGRIVVAPAQSQRLETTRPKLQSLYSKLFNCSGGAYLHAPESQVLIPNQPVSS